MIVTRKLLVTGLVQGVCFRKFVLDTAKKYDISGWVLNVDDGSVQILARGTLTSIGQLESDLWRGTPLSDVKSVKWETSHEQVDEGFHIT